MKKIQQFYIMKFSSGKLDRVGYRLKRIRGGTPKDPNDVRNNQELIALADNQALRTIRSIRYERNADILRYDPEELRKLYIEKRRLKKLPFTNDTKRKISIVNTKIDDMLFIPEYISVVIEKDAHYKKIIKDGLFINGYKYVRLMCSAGQARVNTVILIREDYEEEVKRRLKCGAKEVKITKNKYNAYFALSSSSTYLIPKPNVFLVNDCEIKMTKTVDWISKIPPDEKSPLSNNERVSTETKELEFNLFDGCGAVSVEFAKRVAEALEIDYIPAAFCVRCAYVKGMVFVVDFKAYAKEHNIETVVDLYGNERKIQDMDMILTKSQFKLWNGYDSMDEYDRLCEENGFLWGITKVTPKQDDTHFRSNYQFCQAIDLRRDEDIAELCQPTIDWLTGIVGRDINYTLLYLLGGLLDKQDLDFSNILRMTTDNVAKALILNHDMINDEYIRATIVQSINKKIRETYLGKLVLDGNFSVMIPDMYAFMQHAFGQEVTGALKDGEYYSAFWNDRNVSEVVAMRSPLTWRSEVNKLLLVKNELTEKWFKYLTSGIIYNVWGCDCIIHADSDFDGDIVATTNNSVFLRCRYDNLPITYEKLTVEKEYIKEEDLYLADLQSFNSTIGQITNISTSFYELLSKYEGIPGCEKQEAEIIERLKLIRKSQGDAIDKAKGIKIEPMPKHWTRAVNDCPDGMDVKDVLFVNDIVADRKPYFFRYLYPKENFKYVDFINRKNKYSLTEFGKTITEMLENEDALSVEEKEFLESEYKRYVPLVDYNGRMNKLCHYMEKNLKEIKNRKVDFGDSSLHLIVSDVDRQFNDGDILLMDKFYHEYKSTKKKIRAEELFEGVSTGKWWQYRIDLYERIVNSIEQDQNYIVDLAIYACYVRHPSRTKGFVWDLFGKEIIDNLLAKTDGTITLPIVDENGSVEYLGKRYSEKVIDLTEDEIVEIDDNEQQIF